ncbi:hypothetical protein BaRGS_00039608 [Batillaria attramentaria]|uniref:Telomere-associated protein Rif1 N-terminal domain-containing protein n=1 Tax=Batillaria attramentaria TaxID=370345 RepID=A0ABD0J2T8_9CAEN
MVAVGGGSPLDLPGLLTTLESKLSSSQQRLEAYNLLTEHLFGGELSFYGREIQQQGKRLLKVAKRDVASSGGVLGNVAQKALQVMSYCLHDEELVRFVAATELSALIHLLCRVATCTSEKTTCTLALVCLGRQVISRDIIAAELPEILATLEAAKAKWKGAIDLEVSDVITRLCEQCEEAMRANCAVWGRLVLSQLTSSSSEAREWAFECARKWTTAFSSDKEFIKAASADLKTCIVPGLRKLFQDQEFHTLKVWELLVKIFYEELIHASMLNALLSVVQMALRAPSLDVRAQAFSSWRVFIDVMADLPLMPNWLTEPKHMKLVMVPFNTLNTRTEASDMAKLTAWWHFVRCLGSRVWDNFDLVTKPLLDFCVGNLKSSSKTSAVPGTPTTPRMALESGLKSPTTPKMQLSSSGEPAPTSAKVQMQGFEILAHLIGDASKCGNVSQIFFNLEPLKAGVTVSATSFIKHSGVLITTMFDLLKSLGTKIPEPLLLYVWQSMISRLTSMLESSSRSERREPLSAFLGQFQVLVLSQVLPHSLLLKVLSSTAFSANGQGVKGSPAQFLCEVLLTPSLLKECTKNENFMTVLSMLVQCGTSHPAGVLEFCQSVVELLDRNAQFIPGPEALWRLWSKVASTLQDHISQTNEVNQGDSLEYNFDCMYATLMLPVSHHLGAIVPQPVSKTLMKTWSDLYRTFARLSAMVANAEANIVVETSSHRILETLQKENCLKDGAMLEYVMSVCHVIVDTIDFSSLAPPQTFSLGLSTSPSKWTRRRSKPMGNLHSFVCLVATVMEGIVEGVNSEGEEPPVFAKKKPSESAAQLNVAAITSIDVVTVLVTHVTISSIIGHMLEKLAPPLAGLMTAATKKTSVKLHTPASLQKLDKLWLDVCTMIQSRYSGPYDSDLLAHLSPLLQATFLHPRRQIKNQAVLLWNATFSRSAPLTYPAELQPVLTKVKEKTQIMLPGWSNVDVAVIEETPFSQMSQPDSMAPEPVIPGMPSPTRIRGSFLRKDVSPSPKAAAVSPRRINPAEHRPFGGSARKKLSVDLMPEDDFVVITNTPKKRRVLTEHQKEVLKEKRVIPAMYNNLDASQDVSLMSQLSCSDTQQDTLPTLSGSADCVIMVNSSQSQDQQKQDTTVTERPSAAGSASELIQTPTPRRSSRRKSVHFEESSSSVPASKESDNSSVDGRPWKLNPTESSSLENGSATVSAKESVPSSKSSSDEQGEKSLEGKKSLNLPAPEPNLLAAIGDKLVDTLSSKEMSLSSTKGSSGEEKKDESDENDPFFRPFKALSQSPPVTRAHLSDKNIPENSVRLLTRKTRSQEVIGSAKSAGKEPTVKSAGERPLFTSLEKWLRKTPAVGDKPQASTATESPEIIADSPPLQKTTSMLVEDTQSPKKLARAQKMADLSILETPPKDSASVSLSGLQQSAVPKLKGVLENNSVGDQGSTAADAVLSLGLKEPVLQLERLSEADLAKNAVVTSLPSSMEIDNMETDVETSKQHRQQLETNLDPSVLMDEAASHGMYPESHSTSVSVLASAQSGSSSENKPSLDSQQGKSQNHQNLFGFSELLDASSNDAENADEQTASGSAAVKDSACESMVTNTVEEKSEKCEMYDPGLTSTLQTPPRKRIAPRSLDTDLSSPSSQSEKNSGTSESQASPSQTSSQSESEVPDFDPTKDSTLADAGDHAKRRKQRKPKKIEFPEKLRRTPRRKKQRKSICACCVDGPSPHHGKTHGETTKALESPRKEVATREASSKEDKKKPALSPQDLGEKTPELKSSSTVTPVRKSTTKSKMEVARRRSISKSFNTALERSGQSDSDSEDLPLSQLAQPSKSMTKIVEKGSDSNANERKTSPQSGRVSARPPTRSASKLRLNKLSRQRAGQVIRSPPKLRVRQRKTTGEGARVAKSSEKADHIEVESSSKSPVKTAESSIEEVASEGCLSRDLDIAAESTIMDFSPSSFRPGMSKSTVKKATRKGVVKRLMPVPANRHLRGTRLRTRSHGRRLSSPLTSGSHRRLFRTSPGPKRQLRKRASESLALREGKNAPVKDVLGDDQPVVTSEKVDNWEASGDVPASSANTPAVAMSVQETLERSEDTAAEPCTETIVMQSPSEERSSGSEVPKEDETLNKDLSADFESCSNLQSDDPSKTTGGTTTLVGENKESEMDVDETQVPSENAPADDVDGDAESDSSFHSCHDSPDKEKTVSVTRAETETSYSEKPATNSEDMFDSMGFNPDGIISKEKDVVQTEATEPSACDASDSIEPSAPLFSEPDVQNLASIEDVVTAEDLKESPISVPTFGFSDSFKDTATPSEISVEKAVLEVVLDESATKENVSVTDDSTVKENVDALPVLPVQDSAGDVPETSATDSVILTPQAAPKAVTSSEEKLCKEPSNSDTLMEEETQTDFPPSELDSCKICGSCIQKQNFGDDDEGARSAGNDASTQTEVATASDILDAAETSEMDRSSIASDSKMARVHRLHQRFRIQSDRGMNMVRQSLLQRQLQKQFDRDVPGEDPPASPTGLEGGRNKGVNTSSSLPPPPSPTASPTSGILKKRHPQDDAPPSEEDTTQEGSPVPCKKRRVSFADPVVSGESPSHEATLNKMPWRWESVSRRSSTCLPRELVMSDDLSSTRQQPSTSSQTSQHSQTSQNSYHSTQESQLNATDPIFPELVDCDKPVELVLPQLTSAAWSRGLSQLLAANGITTIGNLASQTEVEVQSRPFRAPKVEVVRSALQQFHKQHYGSLSAKKPAAKSAISEIPQERMSDNQDADKNPVTTENEHELLPSAEEALRQLSPIKGDSAPSDIEEADIFENQDNAAERPMEDLDDEVNMAPRSPMTSQVAMDSQSVLQNQQTHSSEHPQTTPKVSLLEKFTSLAEDDSLGELLRMKKEDLSAIHQQLSMLTNKVVGALINRCPSPPDSQ